MDRTVKPFSAGYFILNADVLTHDGDSVIVPHDYYGELKNYVAEPLLRISEGHYWTVPERGVPAATVAVPEGDGPEDGEPVLMAKNGTAQRLVVTGEKSRPT